MTRYRYHLALLTYLLIPLAAVGQVLPFTHYTPESERTPLPSADIQQVYQDRQGYLWMVVYSSGLARYDGTTLDQYTTDDGLRDLLVRDVLEDRMGRLWVASDAGLVVSEKPLSEYVHGNRIRFTASIGERPLLDTASYKKRIIEDEQGWLWVGTDSDGIIRYRIDPSAHLQTDTIRTSESETAPNMTVKSLVARQNGSVWAGLSGGHLMVFEKASTPFAFFSEHTPETSSYTALLYEDPSGTLWGGENTGHLWKLVESDGERYLATVSRTLDSDIAGIIVSEDQQLWVASVGSGLLKINLRDTTDRQVYTRKNGLLSESLHHVLQDREGNLWFGQSGGISKLRFNYAAFEHITAISYAGETPMLPSPGINAIALAQDPSDLCHIWVGTSEGLVCLGEKGESTTLQEAQGLRDDWVNAVTVDEAGRLWIGTFAGINGLAVGGRAVFPRAPESSTLSFKGQNASLRGFRGTSIVSTTSLPMPEEAGTSASIESLWFPGYKSLYALVDDAWFMFRASSGLPATWYHAVAYGADGTLWVGTRDHGLYQSTAPLTHAALRDMDQVTVPFVLGNQNGTFGQQITAPAFEQIWSMKNGASTDQIESLIFHDGVLWVGTPEGVFTLEGTPLRVTSHLTRQQGLRANNVLTMARSSATGSLWVGTNGGLAEIDPRSREVVHTVTERDGLLDDEVWYYGSVRVGEDGTVYFGTAKGLSIYRPQNDRHSTVEPLLHIKAVHYVEDQKGNNEFAIEYAGLSFGNERHVRYKTRLIGYDEGWSLESADTKIRYTNLPAFLTPTAYTLEIIACNSDGQWTREPLRHSFSVLPAWWLRWWAFVVYITVLAAAFVLMNRAHTAKIIRQERRKAEQEQARLRLEAAEHKSRALAAENERNQIELEKARELEVAYQAIRRQAEEIRHKNQENERLLLNILPEPIATRLKKGEKTIADTFSDVTILFADLVGFTPLSSRIAAPELVEMLNDLFSAFDQLAVKNGIEKIKTIGDAYMAVAGLPEERPDHAEAMLDMAVAMLEAVEDFNFRHDTQLQLRIGLNSGPVVAGVIGQHKFIYDLWGDAVNTASRMESHGIPGRVHMTRSVYEKARRHCAIEPRGEIEIKGKGRMETFLLNVNTMTAPMSESE